MQKPALLFISLLLIATIVLGQDSKTKRNKKPSIDERLFAELGLSMPNLDWTPILTTSTEVYFMHRKRIRTKQGTIKVWIREDAKDKSQLITPVFSLFEINCSQELLRTRRTIYYYKTSVLTSDNKITSWIDIAPDTLADKLRREVCKKHSI